MLSLILSISLKPLWSIYSYRPRKDKDTELTMLVKREKRFFVYLFMTATCNKLDTPHSKF